MWVRVANIDDEDIHIKPRTMIGSVSKCSVQNEHFDIAFNSVGNMEEIIIQHSCEVSETAVPDTETLNYHQIYSDWNVVKRNRLSLWTLYRDKIKQLLLMRIKRKLFSPLRLDYMNLTECRLDLQTHPQHSIV